MKTTYLLDSGVAATGAFSQQLLGLWHPKSQTQGCVVPDSPSQTSVRRLSIECRDCAQSHPHLPSVEAACCQHKEAEVLRCGSCGHMQAKRRLRRGHWP